MKIKPKKFINYIPREPHWLTSRKGFYTMERNERVDEFSSNIMKKIYKEIDSYAFRTYPDTDKIYKQVANWQKIKTNQLILTEGADGGLLRTFQVFISGGDRVITCNPSFAMYPLYCKMFGAKHFPIDLKVKDYDFYSDVIKKIKKIKPRLVAIANPNQPIEIMLNLKQISQICKICLKLNCFVIIDEAYYHFNNVTAKSLIKKFPNLIVVRTFSKAFGLAGMRIGYTMSNSEIIKYMMSIKPIYEINSVNIKIVQFFIKNLKIMKDYVKDVSKSRNFFRKFLKTYKIEMIGEYSNTVLFKLRSKDHVNKVIKYLYKNKFIIRPMTIDGDDSYIRATLGGLKIMKKFTKKFNFILNKIK